jgi:hypothetical protein
VAEGQKLPTFQSIYVQQPCFLPEPQNRLGPRSGLEAVRSRVLSQFLCQNVLHLREGGALGLLPVGPVQMQGHSPEAPEQHLARCMRVLHTRQQGLLFPRPSSLLPGGEQPLDVKSVEVLAAAGEVPARLIAGQDGQEGEHQGVAGHLPQAGALLQLPPQPAGPFPGPPLPFPFRNPPGLRQGPEPAVCKGPRVLRQKRQHFVEGVTAGDGDIAHGPGGDHHPVSIGGQAPQRLHNLPLMHPDLIQAVPEPADPLFP